MATTALPVKTREVYRVTKQQRMQIDGELKTLATGTEVDPDLFTEILLQRMLVLGLLKRTIEKVTPPKPATPSPVETGKTK